jgi:hypothetical protein
MSIIIVTVFFYQKKNSDCVYVRTNKNLNNDVEEKKGKKNTIPTTITLRKRQAITEAIS